MEHNGEKLASSYGIGLFSITLLSQWIAGNVLFTGIEGFFKFGIVGALAFSLAGFFSFNTLIPIVRRTAKQSDSFSLLDILSTRLTPNSFYWMKWLLLAGHCFNLALTLYAGGILLYAFSIPIPIGMLLFFITGLFMVVFLKWKWFTGYSMLKVGLLFLMMIMLLIHSYLLNGIQVIYDGIRLYHPYLLFFNWESLPALFLAFWCVFFGSLLTDIRTWELCLRYNDAKKGLGLLATGFLWSTIPFSMAIIALSAIYLSGFDSVLDVFYRLFTRYDHWAANFILVLVFLMILMGALFSNLKTFFFVYKRPQQQWNKSGSAIVVLFTSLMFLLVKLFSSISILDLFVLFGVFFAACAPAICHLLMNKTKQGLIPVFIILIAALCGWILYFNGFYQYSVISSFSLSVLLTGLQWIYIKTSA